MLPKENKAFVSLYSREISESSPILFLRIVNGFLGRIKDTVLST